MLAYITHTSFYILVSAESYQWWIRKLKTCSYSKTSFERKHVNMSKMFLSVTIPTASVLKSASFEAIDLLTSVSAVLPTKVSFTGGIEASTFKLEQGSAVCTIALQMGRWCQVEKKRQHSLFNTASPYFLPFSFQETRCYAVVWGMTVAYWTSQYKKRIEKNVMEKSVWMTANIRMPLTGFVYLGCILGDYISSLVYNWFVWVHMQLSHSTIL